MARTRMLHPEFFTDADLLAMSPLHRLLFSGLWCYADREGRLLDKPRDIKLRVLPGDACDVDAMLADLAEMGMVVRYEVGGVRCLSIPGFLKRQKPHAREVKSLLPAPPDMDTGPVKAVPSPGKVVPSPEKVVLGPEKAGPGQPSRASMSTCPPVSKSVSKSVSNSNPESVPESVPTAKQPGEEIEVWKRWQDIRGEHALPREGQMPDDFASWYAIKADRWGAILLEEAFCLYCADPWSTADGVAGHKRDGSVRLFMSDQVHLTRLLEAKSRGAA